MNTLSTEQQSAWIERLFLRLTGLYGNEFVNKYRGIDPDQVKQTWIIALMPYDFTQISQAVKACQHIPKAPNAPEFAELCRQFWATSQELEHAENTRKLTPEEKLRFLEITKAVAKEPDLKPMGRPSMKAWAYRLMEREEAGEIINTVAAQFWREALGLPNGISVKDAIEAMGERAA